MHRLMGKYKNNKDWVRIDKTNPDSDYTEKEQMEHILGEYSLTLGKDWKLKWVKDE